MAASSQLPVSALRHSPFFTTTRLTASCLQTRLVRLTRSDPGKEVTSVAASGKSMITTFRPGQVKDTFGSPLRFFCFFYGSARSLKSLAKLLPWLPAFQVKAGGDEGGQAL